MKDWLSVYRFLGLSLLFLLTSWVNPTSSQEGLNSSCITYISTAISPNGDGINDQFRVQCDCDLKNYSLQILNLSSKVVYTSFDSEEVWDGQQDGMPVPEGKYNWIIEYQLHNGDESVKEGELVLIR